MRILRACLLALGLYGVSLLAPVPYTAANCAGKEILGERTLQYLYEKGEIGYLCLVLI